MEHHRPLECRHGCSEAEPHRCAADSCEDGGYTPLSKATEFITRGNGRDPRRPPL